MRVFGPESGHGSDALDPDFRLGFEDMCNQIVRLVYLRISGVTSIFHACPQIQQSGRWFRLAMHEGRATASGHQPAVLIERFV